MTHKTCFTCKKELDVSLFYIRNKIKQTYKGSCIECEKINRRKYLPKCECGNEKHPDSKSCHECRVKKQVEDTDYNSLTLGDKTYDNHKYAKYAYVRYYSRKLAGTEGYTKCMNCGYNKHVEICHIKPIASFPKETLLTEINHIDNLISLCPNCHWEFDNGILELSTPTRT